MRGKETRCVAVTKEVGAEAVPMLAIGMWCVYTEGVAPRGRNGRCRQEGGSYADAYAYAT